MPKYSFEYDELDIKNLILQDLAEKYAIILKPTELEIKVMSKQNYRVQEWETGKLKCAIDVRK